MDGFSNKIYKPMLIKSMMPPFDSSDWIYEIKWDGIRCLAYLDNQTELVNKRGKQMLQHVPELSNLHTYTKSKCILDGELLVLKAGKPDFYEVQSRSIMSNAGKISIRSTLYPATFIAYDILYKDGKELLDMTQLERKKELDNIVLMQDGRFVISKYIDTAGVALFSQVKQQGLEGVVAKKKNGTYMCGKKTDNWIKFKNMTDQDFIICGYIKKKNNMTSFILGQYNLEGQLLYKGHVTLGASIKTLSDIHVMKRNSPPFDLPPPTGNEDAIWLEPVIVGVVQYMTNTENAIRQPVFKGFRDDVTPQDCISN